MLSFRELPYAKSVNAKAKPEEKKEEKKEGALRAKAGAGAHAIWAVGRSIAATPPTAASGRRSPAT